MNPTLVILQFVEIILLMRVWTKEFWGPDKTISDMIKYIIPDETIIFLLNLSQNMMFGPFLC